MWYDGCVFGLDELLAGQAGGWTFALLVAVLLGLRHATDPDHLTAILTLRLPGSKKSPHLIGLGWGVGHAVTMIAIGVPLILLTAMLPERLQQTLELAVGVMIVAVAISVLWRLGVVTAHSHAHTHHDGTAHSHAHAHGQSNEHSHRTPRSAFAMGLLHGGGGSAGVVALILASQPDKLLACVALVVISIFSGLSMMACSWLMCRGVDHLDHRLDVRIVAGVGAVASLAFGVWYCAAAVAGVWYPF